jgi:hypothetical protein
MNELSLLLLPSFGVCVLALLLKPLFESRGSEVWLCIISALLLTWVLKDDGGISALSSK